jgi:3-hydroxyisobutyrate dehydrogenase
MKKRSKDSRLRSSFPTKLDMNEKPTVALLGLGIMGSAMAHNLLVKGFGLTVFNRDPRKAKPFAEAGGRVASSPREAAAKAHVVLAMVADDDASRGVWLGETGALAGVRPGTICIDSSTLTVHWVRELASAVAARRCNFLDAPVTGSKVQANAGELNFLIGGEPGVLEKARPVLSAIGKNIWLLGPTGSGAMVKLVNNFLCGVQVASLAEAMAMIERSGLDRAKALEVLTNGAVGSPLVKTISARMTGPDYTPNFLLRLLAKDLNYARQESERLSLELVTARAALERLEQAIAAGCGEMDMAAVVEPLRRKV